MIDTIVGDASTRRCRRSPLSSISAPVPARSARAILDRDPACARPPPRHRSGDARRSRDPHVQARRARRAPIRGTFDDGAAAVRCRRRLARAAPRAGARRASARCTRRIREALRPGGVLLVADAIVHEAGAERAWIYDAWARHMAHHGIDRAAADKLFATWALEDTFYPLAAELGMLADAGFARADCFWKHGPIAVYGAFA